MTNDVCPHCGQRMLLRFGVAFPPKLADIFDVINTPRGATTEVLSWVIYPDKTKRQAAMVIKANIWRINELLVETDLKIARPNPGEPYRVEHVG